MKILYIWGCVVGTYTERSRSTLSCFCNFFFWSVNCVNWAKYLWLIKQVNIAYFGVAQILYFSLVKTQAFVKTQV